MKILGLDLGTNSIGWAVIDPQKGQIDAAGSRIIPMDAAVLSDFDKGNSISQTAQRTQFRGVRRLKARHLLRRERLHRVLNVLGFLPEHYAKEIDFEKRLGQFRPDTEPKLPWREIAPDKFEFIFKESFEQMLSEFKSAGTQSLIPYDWTIYYLRKKALHSPITSQELAWLLLNFNQKRGYYQLRGEDEQQENENKIVEFYALKVVGVEATDEKKGRDTWYNVLLENGWVYRRTSAQPLDWVGTTKEFIVTTDLEKDGTPKLNKQGAEKRSFRAPSADDWTLVKKRTESEIAESGKSVGEYIYDTLLANPSQKINGKLVRVVERKFYKEELRAILAKQREFNMQLQDKELYNACVNELYRNNEGHRKNLAGRDVCHLLLNDVIFYQRPLKSKKSLIADCPYEFQKYVDKETGEIKNIPLKAISKSHPLYQEFRLWQFVANLKIYRLGDGASQDEDVTSLFIKDYSEIFRWLNDKKEIDQKGFLSNKEFGLKRGEVQKYRWNYVDKAYPCNETRALMLYRLSKNNLPTDFLNDAAQIALWHLLYSVTDSKEIVGALGKFARRYNIDKDSFVNAFSRCKPFANDYGAYSEKAIKKLLAVMRMGEYWNQESISDAVKERIDKIISDKLDGNIDERTVEKCAQLKNINNFSALPLWLACYVVYGRHSEAKDVEKWNSPADIDIYLRNFKQHSLRNPIVEQVVTETLRTVRDIWKQSGEIDEIHIELGREMKNPANVRKEISARIAQNEDTNIRIKMLLAEFANAQYNIEGVRPYSPSQRDILRIYEDEVLNANKELPEDIELTIKKFRETDVSKQPSKAEVMRYKLWLEQQYRSPYTGEIIPLGKLFTPAYEIEHVIAQSRFFDDSLSNKVICESEVNKLKGSYLGYQFIKEHHGEKVTLSSGKTVTIFEPEAYEQFVKERYAANRGKMKKLLMEDIPEDFNQRQLNDTRYISKFIKGLLSNIVREESEIDAVSKYVVSCTGGVTDRLKQEWGVNNVWNDIVYQRFERLNEMTQSQNFGQWTSKDGKRVFQTQIPIELSKGFNKKRIDHRHHAMDAVVIACATRNHINYLNNDNGKSSKEDLRYDLKNKLCYKTKADANGNYTWQFHKPWETFTQDTRTALEDIIVGFKQNLRVINRATNRTLHYNAAGKKVLQEQSNTNWAIRKSMHKDTVFGEVNLRMKRFVRISEAIEKWQTVVDGKIRNHIKMMLSQGADAKAIAKSLKDSAVSKVEVYYFTSDNVATRMGATRKSIDTSFDKKKIASITDSGIVKIMLAHLENCDSNAEIAFSADGIVKMNAEIATLNGGKNHKPIYKVRICEPLGSKFEVGRVGNKSKKFVEADKGTNLFFAIYADEQGKRNYDTIPLNVAIERQRQGLSSAPDTDAKGNELLYVLSPNDLVYLPTQEQIGRPISCQDVDRERIYKMVSSTGEQCCFIKHRVANTIVYKFEYSSLNKMERAITGEMIKLICVPLKVDRLGNITKI